LLLTTPPTVTVMYPFDAPLGTVVEMLVELQLVGVAVIVPSNFTMLVPCVEPKFVPVIVSAVPTGAIFGETLVIVGDCA
jgi:hypothetical protein